MLKMTCVTTVALATMLYVRESWDDLSVRVSAATEQKQ